MWHKLQSVLRKNLFWIIVLIIILVPGLRSSVQVLANQAFSYVNWVTEEEEPMDAELSKLVLIDYKGQELRGESLKGKVVFVNMWATWCPPCIAEMPSIQKLYDDYKDKVEFIMVSNEPFEKTTQFKALKSYDFKVYRPKSIPQIIDGSSIPRTAIIDSQGRVVVLKKGAVDWNSKTIRDLLDGLLFSI